MNLALIGTGYVGLVSGTCFAEMGNDVICVDIDAEKVKALQQGKLPIYEPDLDVYLHRNLREGRLHFTTDLAEAFARSEILFLALPTPPGEDGSADLSYVLGVAEQLAGMMREVKGQVYKVIVNKSTVPVGTADKVQAILEAQGLEAGIDFDVVSNPEFLREGVAVGDFMKPERVVIGAAHEKAIQMMQVLYEPFVRQGNPIQIMDIRSAELTKYAANAFLATKITFMNEMANLCDRVGADIDAVRAGIGSDSRIGKQFLYAGIGFGGSCFPKDVKALAKTAKANDYDFQILDAVLNVNQSQQAMMVGRVQDFFQGNLEGKTIAIWGLAFKPNTDDVREAPSHVIIRGLLAAGARIQAYDPEAIETTRVVLGDTITYASNAYQALEQADALVICTEWHEFRRPNFDKMKTLLTQPVIFDGRNLYNTRRMADSGFIYYSVGRPHHASTEADALLPDKPTAVSSM